MELGKKIRQLRRKAGFTQEQLAEKLGIGAQSVSKWENTVAMPDISLLPTLAEVFGVTIDDMFDLTVEQRFNRMENNLDNSEEIPQDIFREYEDFLKEQMNDPQNKKRAPELLAYLYWHRMESFARKAAGFAKDAIRMSPAEKGCQWILSKSEGHAVWDWNIRNHTAAIEYWYEICRDNPGEKSPCYYLLDNLLADHRADEAEEILSRLCGMKDASPVINEVYRAHLALARFDEPTADGIMERLVAEHADDFACLFEAAQYYAEKCAYDKALDLYERAFAAETRRPRFQDELMAIRDIHQIRGDYKKAAETCDRIIDLFRTEWGYTDEIDIELEERRKAALLEKAQP